MTTTGERPVSLAAAIGGRVILPADADYDAMRQTFNGLTDRRPAAIAQPVDAAGVARAIRAARDAGLPIGVRGGGHSVAGHAYVEGGVTIDLREMRSVTIDPLARRAAVAGGALWADVDGPALAHGLGVPGGVFGDTGVGGLALGGGIGFLMGVAGLTCDNIVGAELVTADGTIVEVDAERDPDLLWALRGGGGNFGVVTRFDLALHPVGPMFGGRIQVPLADGAVLRRYARVMRDAPDELLVMVDAFQDPDGGGPRAGFQVAFLGDAATGRAFVNEIVGRAEPTLDALGVVTYLEIQAINELLEFGLRHYWKSTFVDQLEDVVDDIVAAAASARAWSGVLIEPIHGQARRVPASHAAFPQRSAHWHVSALAVWDDPADDPELIAWSRANAAAFERYSVGGTYINYITPDEPPDRARTAYPPEVLARLRGVKARVDPENVFRSNINIAP